jgi:uncharacterized protein YehS (DUF1456 family)
MACVPRRTKPDRLHLKRRRIMLNEKDNKTLQEVMMAFHAKNKLDEVAKFLKKHKDDSVSTKEVLAMIEKEDEENDYF